MPTATIQQKSSTQSNYLAFRKFQQSVEKKYTPLVKKALQAQQMQYINYANKNGWVQAAANINIVVTNRPIEQVLRRLYDDCAARWGWYNFNLYRNMKGFFQDTIIGQLIAEINQYFDNFILSMVQDISDTNKKFIQQQIIAGLADGLGYDDIARSIITSDSNLMRARRIARTESGRASNVAAKDGAKKTGILMLKKWNSAQDARTRSVPKDRYDHLHLNGVTIGMDEKFASQSKTGIVYMDAPGDITAPPGEVVNCRCALSFVPQRDNNGRVIRI